MRLGLFGILSIVTAFCACTQSSPASSDDDSVSLGYVHPKCCSGRKMPIFA